LQIFNLYRVPLKKGLFKSIKKQKKVRQLKAQEIIPLLMDYSNLFFEYLDVIEIKIKKLL
jgi:hypothetical protein